MQKKKPDSIRAVLFDMDGVIVNSEKHINRAAVEMFKEKGYEVDPEDFTQFTGMGENKYLGGVAEIYNIPSELEKDKARTYEIYESLVREKLDPLPGVKDFIAKCKKRNLKLALASSADKIKVEINLREIGIDHDTFQGVISAEDVTHKKPAPDIFLKAAEKLDVSIENCLVIEDAVSGVKAGKTAGAKVLALTTSFEAQDLVGADWIAGDLSGVGDEVVEW